MTDQKLDFSLPDRGGKGHPSRSQTSLLLLILLVLLANLAVTLFSRPKVVTSTAPASLSAETLKQLALKTEKQGLHSISAHAWQEYLQRANPPKEEVAKIYYRMAKLYQDAGEHTQALENFYRSESYAQLPELEPEIARRTQESLEALGKFAALRYDLTDRVSLDPQATNQGEEIVAEIGAQKITKAELDGKIEASIDHQLSQFASMMPAEERKQQKEKMLKQLASGPARAQFLQQYIAEEILYRQAREEQLPQDPQVRELLKDSERRLLAQQIVARQLGGQINLTGTDLTTYYQAHQEEYKLPERARVAQILVSSKERAREIQGKLADGESFDELAVQFSENKGKPELPGWVNQGGAIPGIGESAQMQEAIFNTEAGQVAESIVQTDQGYHLVKVLEREPERMQSFDEVKNEVYRKVRQRKEQEVQEQLLKDLQDKYNVVIHQSVLGQEEK